MSLTADALNTALLHSLWQDAIVGLVLWGALVVMRRSSANARYLACCAALALMALLPLVTTIVLSERAVSSLSSMPASLTVPAPVNDAPVREVTSVTRESGAADWLAPLAPWALPVWLAGVLACSLRLVLASAQAVVLRRRSDPEDGEIAATVARLAARIGLRRSVAVRLSVRTDSPATLGLLRPVILLPPAVALGVTSQQLEALLAHELAHIRRYDYLVNLLQMLVETLFFYHPAIWWASKRIRVERELCCDDIAVDACGDAVSYAQALTKVARMQLSRPGLALGATGGPFLQRIQRLLGVTTTSRPACPLWVTVASVVMIVAVMFTGSYAQSSLPGTLAPGDASANSTLSGRVVDARSGRPVAGASVRAQYTTGVEHPTKCPIGDCEDIVDPVAGRVVMYRATTGSDGHFAIPDMRPGDYLVAATAPGYVQRYFGETANDTPEASVRVAAGQRTPSIDVPLERAGSVSGRILSDTGDGLEGVEVELLRRTYLPGGARPVAIAFAQAEKGGTYHFRDVAPGEYYVRAYAAGDLRPSRKDVPLSYVTTLFPDATDVAFARPVILGSGQELDAVDFALATARRRSVTGRLVDPAGASLAHTRVNLMPHTTGTLDVLQAFAAADGTFRFADVPAGDYMVTVFDLSDRRSWSTAVRDISVFEDVNGLQLIAGLSQTVSGRVALEGGRPLPFDATDLQLATEQRTSGLGTHAAGFAKITADGSFTMRSGTGALHLRILGVPPGWFVKSVQLNGVDVTDAEFDLVPGGEQRFDITLTDHVSRLAGTVTDRSARPVSNALVVVFPEDRARWANARSIRTTFSHQQGRYEMDSLPIARYRVVAVTSLPRNAWTDPEVLARLLPDSSPISLDDLGQGTLQLRVVQPPTDLLQ
jgi:beta-lactamase regulating signal transducer with metallopeptidase domain